MQRVDQIEIGLLRGFILQFFHAIFASIGQTKHMVLDTAVIDASLNLQIDALAIGRRDQTPQRLPNIFTCCVPSGVFTHSSTLRSSDSLYSEKLNCLTIK